MTGTPPLPSKKDTLFCDEERALGNFQFDEAVARVFPDMLTRSIPGYSTLLHLIGVHAAQDLPPTGDETGGAAPPLIYDLGCSLGAVTLSIRHALGAREAKIVAIDSSSAMVKKCAEVIQADSGLCPVEVREGDITRLDLEPCSLVVLNFTLQFAPVDARQRILTHIFQRLAPRGSLILSEKTEPERRHETTFFHATHDAFRRQNGYSQLELSRKRLALEKVLIPESPEAYERRLTAAGFEAVRWFRCLQFVSWVAKKPALDGGPNEDGG